ncbi:nuclear transport factor 2 family protein [Spirosoma spitsbergense]|uniref:nuclear transport factor 2 family protein n=1 Tax=Spirosoma spitsbergense TaxID=431554 RepID=UPI0003807DFE|nr:nuclear transport factor 2 family protein [Spirosoma spitsbergense]
MHRKTLLFTLVAFCSLLSVNSIAQSKDEGAIGKAVEQMRLLMINPDKAKLEALAADQLTYGHSTGKLENKAAFVEALISGASDFVSINLTDQTITIVDNTALVRHNLSADTLNNGKPGQAHLSVLLVWIKQKGNWQLLARQAVKI